MRNDSSKRRPSAQPFLLFLTASVCLALTAAIPQGQPSKPACANNLRQIDGAKEQWALENHAPAGSPVSMEQIVPFIKGGQPSCSSGGVYTIGRVDEAPRCSIPEHVLHPPPLPMAPIRKLLLALAAISALLALLTLRSTWRLKIKRTAQL